MLFVNSHEIGEAIMDFDRIKKNMPIVILLFMLSTMAFICIDAERDNPNDPGSSSYNVIDKIYLFDAGTTDGNLGGRSGADSICDASPNKPAACKHACYAFISSDSDHEIRDLQGPTYNIPDAPFYGPDGAVKIADNWDDLLDGSIDVSLTDAGVLPVSSWWSGSESDGSFAATQNCTNWTGTASQGIAGLGDRYNAGWINMVPLNCTDVIYLLCICH
jgi:hypothetical protein